jgi:hypothetical protein
MAGKRIKKETAQVEVKEAVETPNTAEAEAKAKAEADAEAESKVRDFWEKDGMRHFTFNDVVYRIRMPGLEEQRQADWEYSRTFTKALMEGVPAMKELEKLLTSRGIIKVEFARRENELNATLQSIALKLTSEDTPGDEKTSLTLDFEEARQELLSLRQERQTFVQNTAEGKADESRLTFMTWRCSEFGDGPNIGKSVWKTLPDFRNERDLSLVWNMLFHYMSHSTSATLT